MSKSKQKRGTDAERKRKKESEIDREKSNRSKIQRDRQRIGEKVRKDRILTVCSLRSVLMAWRTRPFPTVVRKLRL